MSERATPAIRAKWNARYGAGGDAVPAPAAVLSRHERLLPPAADGNGSPRDALDLACGRAGNGERLASLGFRTVAWDVSDAVVRALRERPGSALAEAVVRDVVAVPPAPGSFDVIVVARFLERALCPAIAAALRPGGRLLYQTFTAGLRNPDFLLGPNELPALFPGLDVLAYREPPADARGRAEAMLVGRSPTVPAAT